MKKATFSLATEKQRRWRDAPYELSERLIYGARTVRYGICARHYATSLFYASMGIVIAIVGLCVGLLGIQAGNGVVKFAGILILMAGCAWWRHVWPPLRRVKCSSGKLWLKGTGLKYLNNLFSR